MIEHESYAIYCHSLEQWYSGDYEYAFSDERMFLFKLRVTAEYRVRWLESDRDRPGYIFRIITIPKPI